MCFPYQALASDDKSGEGKMQIKTNRILEENEETFETELDKIFPDLFEDEIKSKIITRQIEKRNTKNELMEVIFTEKLEPNTFLNEVKNQIFTESYVAPITYTKEDEEKKSSNSISSVLFYASIATFIVMMFGGIFLLLRKWEM